MNRADRYYWIMKGTTWFTKYCAKDDDYLEQNFSTVRPVVNQADMSRCPKCGTNHSSWDWREGNDLFCYACGFREAEYFNDRLNKFIEWVKKQEAKQGEPVLLSDDEQKTKERINENVRNSYWRHHDKSIEKGRLYRERNIEKERERSKRYALLHKDEIRERKRLEYLRKKELVKV